MKTIEDVFKFLVPLHKVGRPFLVSKEDYDWIREVQTKYFPLLKDKNEEMTFRGETFLII